MLASQLPGLQAKGLIRGGSLTNAVVFDTNGVRNPEGLRYENEPARHKVFGRHWGHVFGGLPDPGALPRHQGGARLARGVVALPVCRSNSVALGQRRT